MIRNDWVEVKIDEIIASDGIFSDGDWVESKDQDPLGEVRLIQLADIGDGFFRDKSNRFLTLDKSKELNCTYLKENDILLARMPEPLGRAVIFPLKSERQYVTVVDVAIIRPSNEFIKNKYLMHNINSPFSRKNIQELQSGTTRKRISRKNLSKINFPLAPLPEQRAIVAKIEKLFSDLDNGIANLKAAKGKLEIYRQAVLKKAFEGELTKEWRGKHGVCFKWKKEKMEDHGEWKGGGTPSKRNSAYWKDGNVLWVSPKDMKCKIILDTKDKISESSIKHSSTKWIEKGAVLFVVRSGIIRRMLPIAIAGERLTVNQDLQSFSPNEYLSSEFVYWYCSSEERIIREQCAKDGTTVDSINVPMLKRHLIPIPSIEEQHAIVAEIESRLSVCDKLTESIDQSLEKCEALRQSILKKAFAGQLLSQAELAACRMEPDWEPADKLLKRIREAKS
ncbi:MAG: restriction endonuclease subunit S [Desulfobacterales bacterium]|nr:restriction endonuclease subunit S [Desulfobacterales bacterium]